MRASDPPVALLLIGLPGAGKSTVARAIAAEFDWPVISRDDLRPVLLPRCEYSEEEKDFEVDVVRQAMGFHLSMRHSVVIDGISFEKTRYLTEFRRTIGDSRGKAVAVMLEVTVDTASDRVESQRLNGDHPAVDRDRTLVERVAEGFDDIPSSIPRVDAERERDQVLGMVRGLVVDAVGEPGAN